MTSPLLIVCGLLIPLAGAPLAFRRLHDLHRAQFGNASGELGPDLPPNGDNGADATRHDLSGLATCSATVLLLGGVLMLGLIPLPGMSDAMREALSGQSDRPPHPHLRRAAEHRLAPTD